MDRASSLIFPGGRTLAAWWRQLAPQQPTALGIGYAFLHRIEAPVTVQLEQPIDPLAHLVLQALALENGAGVRVGNLEERLRLPGAALQRILAGMLETGLLERAETGAWRTSERGRHAQERGSVPVRAVARRVFPFLEHIDPVGQRLGAPQFTPMAECIGTAWTVDEAHRFDPAELQRAIAQPPEWKESFGFPHDVETAAADSRLEAWQQVVVDRPERVLVALIVANEDVLGFAVKADGWTLLDRTPVIRLRQGEGTKLLWPDPPTMQIWQDAWRSWCKQRQLPTNEVEICALNYRPPRLEVQAPGRLVQRLQAAKSDLFKGEAWILAGDGYLRTAAQLAIKEPHTK